MMLSALAMMVYEENNKYLWQNQQLYNRQQFGLTTLEIYIKGSILFSWNYI